MRMHMDIWILLPTLSQTYFSYLCTNNSILFSDQQVKYIFIYLRKITHIKQ